MTTVLIITLLIVTPIILLPAAFVWYLNIGGIIQAVKEARKEKVAQTAKAK
jgi:hypothetical protein